MTIVDAMMAINLASVIITKSLAAIKEGKAVDLTEEIAALEKCRLAPSQAIIDQADAAMGKK